MTTLTFDLTRDDGKFKPLNATNGGPWHKRQAGDQNRSNFKAYKAARIPYSRNHDSWFSAIYGGPYSHDVTAIFRNFDADVNDPASYDFTCTDESILTTLDAGTETFFRLGESIEHRIKKYTTFPPKDFQKWAEICEHIIRHYNEGWADGYHLGIKYWEIWGEPDLDSDDNLHKGTWGGTKAQFFELYKTAAKHLKSCFPELMIGGPALSGYIKWAEDFLQYMKENEVPIDFFSWHMYCAEPAAMVKQAGVIRAMLDRHGYNDSMAILDELNYIKGWMGDEYLDSIMSIHGMKGAAFTMACISEAQHTDGIDMLMYYDTRPSAFCGAFDFYSYKPLKGYYPLYWYGKFYDMDTYVKCETSADGLYTLCGKDKDGKVLCVVTNYSDDDDAPEIEVRLDFGRSGKFEVYRLDAEHDGELTGTVTDTVFTMPNQSCILLREI